jgi:hypothetical protein
MSYTMQIPREPARLTVRIPWIALQPDEGSHGVSETGSESTEARARSLRWMESLWDGASTTTWEEHQKEEVLAVFRELARESKREGAIHEYVPWQPLW